MRGLADKGVLVTGGTSGIGAATAARFLEEGSRVCVFGRDAGRRERIAERLPELSGVFRCDVTVFEQVQNTFKEAISAMGSVDVLVNNAGVSIRHRFVDITPEAWDQVLAVNLTGAFYMGQLAARHMLERGAGVIINISSTSGMMAYPYYADYNAAKAGLIELTRSMALELAPQVRVVAVAPGYVLTPMQEAEYSQEMLDEVNRKIPLERHAEPGEIAAMVAFLASDEAAYASGQVFVVDGAESAGALTSR
jgi:NAD(P)-dependent dehydrogenase (short-subunit alcohol dehydrogenase family)